MGTHFGTLQAPRSSYSSGAHLTWSPKILHASDTTRHAPAIEIDGAVITTARERAGGWWEVGHWPRFFLRNQAITAPTVTVMLETGHRSDAPVVVALREELR
jgi:hypothetical protein